VKVAVEQLRLGMYVAELDRPWLDTKFPFQGFYISSEADLARLRQTCKSVFVDPEKGLAPRVAGAAAAALPTRYPERVPVEREFVHARTLFDDCRRLFDKLVKIMAAGGELDAEGLKNTMEKLADSIERNPDAMLLLTQVRQKDEKQLERALDVSVLMMTFARFLQLPRDEMDLLGLVGLLQDIGKVKTPDSILNKKGGLSAEELKQARLHVAHSAAMLRDAHGLPQRLADLVLLHHERYDGSGYPRRLAGPGIGMMGCMAAIVDGFSAMTSIRPYAEQMSPSNALGMLYKERGTRYHEALVEQFIQCIGIYPVGSLVQLNSGEIGVVIAQNRVRRLQPRVMVLLDAASKPIMPQTVLDLIKEPKSPTGEPYRIRRTIESGKLPLDPHDFFL
jgi:HD-GYP domain-containing protein (c-di-GMP phosphodiesterase class II)